MSPEERAALKAAVHTARKERLAASVRGSELCRGCGWPVDDDTNWSCGVCRERVRSRHRHDLEKRDREIADLRGLLDEGAGKRIAHLVGLLDERDGKVRELCRDLEARDARIAQLVESLDERNAKVRELRDRISFMRSGPPMYESEEERLEARRRSWRESKRRAYRRGKAAA